MKLSLKTLLGSETVEPEYRTLDGEETRVFYVEVGKSFELGYVVDEDRFLDFLNNNQFDEEIFRQMNAEIERELDLILEVLPKQAVDTHQEV